MNKSAIILLSGGLDSTVSLALNKNIIGKALFFDYGQKSLQYELLATRQIAKYYNIDLEVIELNWLKNITHNAITDNSIEIPHLTAKDLNNTSCTSESSKSVWIPNRNGLFINIAACYCDAYNYKQIIIGANKEEAATFVDNSEDFINNTTNSLKFSTQSQPTVIAPLIKYDKNKIVELGIEYKIPLEMIRSCYSNMPYHCGVCESCQRLKRGLERANLFDIVELVFGIKEKA